MCTHTSIHCTARTSIVLGVGAAVSQVVDHVRATAGAAGERHHLRDGEAGDLHAVPHAGDDVLVLAGGLERGEEAVVGVVLRGVDAALAVRESGKRGVRALPESDGSGEDDEVGVGDVRVVRLHGFEQVQDLETFDRRESGTN